MGKIGSLSAMIFKYYTSKIIELQLVILVSLRLNPPIYALCHQFLVADYCRLIVLCLCLTHMFLIQIVLFKIFKFHWNKKYDTDFDRLACTTSFLRREVKGISDSRKSSFLSRQEK